MVLGVTQVPGKARERSFAVCLQLQLLLAKVRPVTAEADQGDLGIQLPASSGAQSEACK